MFGKIKIFNIERYIPKTMARYISTDRGYWYGKEYKASRFIVDGKSMAVYWYCSVGKDRRCVVLVEEKGRIVYEGKCKTREQYNRIVNELKKRYPELYRIGAFDIEPPRK